MSRRKAREVAFKVVFQVDQVGAEPETAFKYLVDESNLAEKDRDFSWELVQGSLNNQELIDGKISRYSTAWDLDRMSSVDRNIMRIAAYEILSMVKDEAVIAIDEAIEICKKYSDEGSSSFVNAILDKILGEKM